MLLSLERKKKRTARKLKDWLVKQREVLEERACRAVTLHRHSASATDSNLLPGFRWLRRRVHRAHGDRSALMSRANDAVPRPTWYPQGSPGRTRRSAGCPSRRA